MYVESDIKKNLFEGDWFSDLPEALIRAHKVKNRNVFVCPNLFVIIIDKSNNFGIDLEKLYSSKQVSPAWPDHY